jgi:hypothetical protein
VARHAEGLTDLGGLHFRLDDLRQLLGRVRVLDGIERRKGRPLVRR